MRITHRNDYNFDALLESDLAPDPIAMFARWYREAELCEVPEANAFTLATVDEQGQPDARIVLMKEYRPDGISFFTNYLSKKGKDLLATPQVCANFFWQPLMRQVRLHGEVEMLSREESEAYFNSRPIENRLATLASRQSMPLQARNLLENEVEDLRKSLGTKEPRCPSWWGGYLIRPHQIEFWQGRPNRLHDRLTYTIHTNGWEITRSYP